MGRCGWEGDGKVWMGRCGWEGDGKVWMGRCGWEGDGKVWMEDGEGVRRKGQSVYISLTIGVLRNELEDPSKQIQK